MLSAAFHCLSHREIVPELPNLHNSCIPLYGSSLNFLYLSMIQVLFACSFVSLFGRMVVTVLNERDSVRGEEEEEVVVVVEVTFKTLFGCYLP